MEKRKQRIRGLAKAAVALIQLGFSQDQVLAYLSDFASQLWDLSADTLNEYVNAAYDQAVVELSATRKSLYTWVPPRNSGEQS